jgi:hypothetical protein
MTNVIFSKAVDKAQVWKGRRRREEAALRQSLSGVYTDLLLEHVDQPPVALPQPPSANSRRGVGWERQMIEGT